MRFIFLLLLLPALSMAALKPAPDANNYINQYEKPLLFGADQCRGGYSCYTVPTACHRTITTGDGNWDKIYNNSGDKVFCIQKGDHTSKGPINTNFAGTNGNEKWLIYEDGAGVEGLQVNPYNQSPANRAAVEGLIIDQGYWIVNGLYVDGNDGYFDVYVDANNVVVDNLAVDGQYMGADTDAAAVKVEDNSENVTVQNSTIFECKLLEGLDTNGVSFPPGSDNIYFVGNEIWDCSDNIITSNAPDTNVSGGVIENNDMYKTSALYIDCADTTWPYTFTPTGNCVCSENYIDLKQGGSSTSDPLTIMQNRFWGIRPGSQSSGGDCGATGEAQGDGLQFQNSSSDYILVKNNIMEDSQKGVRFATGASYNEVTGNVFHDFEEFYSGQPARVISFEDSSGGKNLVADNTIANNENVAGMDYVRLAGDSRFDCNAMIDAQNVDGSFSGSGASSYNAIIGDSASPGGSNQTVETAANSNLINFTYYRKLITGPELVTVTGIKPTATTPWLNHCSGWTAPSGYGMN